MLFWIVMIVLLAASAFLIFQCVLAVKSQYGIGGRDSDDYDRPRRRNGPEGREPGRKRRDDDYEDDYDDGPGRRRRDDYGDGYDDEPGRGRRDDYDYDDEPEQRRASRPVRRQWRILMENLDTWEKYTYQFYDTVGIGRAKDDPEFEYFLTVEGDPKVSKHHCVIVNKDGKLYLEDLGSTNGTFLNEERLNEAVLLQKEDVIRIGETQIEVKKILRERD